MEYDKQGNITSLVRTTYLNSNENNSIENNNLSFSYDGNRLKKVENAGTPYFPYISRFFVDKAHTETEYQYDANGMDEAIGVVAGHESGHTEKNNTKQAVENQRAKQNGNPIIHDVEARPIEIENKILNELKNKILK